jgi:hypothetical protein
MGDKKKKRRVTVCVKKGPNIIGSSTTNLDPGTVTKKKFIKKKQSSNRPNDLIKVKTVSSNPNPLSNNGSISPILS